VGLLLCGRAPQPEPATHAVTPPRRPPTLALTLPLALPLTRYATSTPTYVYRLSGSLSIDARDSDHFSRYLNHHAQPNLHAKVSRTSKPLPEPEPEPEPDPDRNPDPDPDPDQVNRTSKPARIDFFAIR